jgi:hypothetical protein
MTVNANNLRYDLSDRLIHFFRRVKLDQIDAPPMPESFGRASIHEDEVLTPIYMLRHALRMGRLYATWSVRGGRRTIYGPRPAVCFTEMPLTAFVEAGRQRAAAGQAMSAYGIVFPKAATFTVGARPVIYGLSGYFAADQEEPGAQRDLPAQALPAAEQFRYVAYNPAQGNLDWSHEREWRWPLNTPPWESDGSPPAEADELPGLDLDDTRLSGLGVVVATNAEADAVVYDIVTKVDRGDIASDHYSFVLAHEMVQDWTGLRDRGALDQEVDRHLISLAPLFEQTEQETDALVGQYEALVKRVRLRAPKPQSGETGGCWLWLLDNTADLTRALLRRNLAFVNGEGKYLVRLPDWSADHSLAQREVLAKQIAQRVLSHFGIQGTYFSVRLSSDPDALPFYNGDMLDNDHFYNWNRP